MGCHTWTYKKLSAISEEEKQNKVDKRIKELENWWGFKQDFNSIVKEVSTWEPDFLCGKTPEQYATEMLQKYTIKLNNIKKTGWNEYVKEIRNSYSCDIEEKDGELYYLLGANIPFRAYDYPEEEFTDKDSLISWLKEKAHQITYYIDDIRYEGYSYELEKMINEFFEKHGENNLLFTFG